MGAAVLSITQLREEVAGLVTGAGVKAYAKPPAAFSAPGVVIDLEDPPLTFDDVSFGSVKVHLNLYLLVNPSPKWEEEVLVMIAKTVNVLRGKVEITSVELYDEVKINNSTARIHQGALIKIAAEVALKEMI